ncbi:MAG: response regulator [Planctomycetes bacterium]|nr:response regulator [Planctomycetota bacterium]
MVDLSKPYRLLLADDDAAFRQTVRAIFEPHFQLYEAEAGDEALRIVEGERIDLALFDVHMPRMTGLEALQQIRTFNIHLPCILITADFSEELRRTATQADAWRILAKPVTRTDLVTTVATALEEAYNDPDAWPGML